MKRLIYLVVVSFICYSSIAQSLILTTKVVNPGNSISVSFAAPSDYPSDAWIGIVPSSIQHGSEAENDKNDLSYEHLKKRTNGTLTFKAPDKPGNYDFRMHNTDFSGKEVASVSFVVSDTKIPKSTSSSSSSYTQTHNVAGVYKTDFNEMTLQINGNRVTGTYKYSGGKVEGILKGNTLTGTWTQTNGNGKIEFVFNSDFTAFTGKWGYNNSIPSGKWNGTKISGFSGGSSTTQMAHKIAGVYTTNFNDLTLQINGNQVTGTYQFRNGKVSGILNGNTLVGIWTQDNGKGKLVFEFNSDFSEFTGKWGYDESSPTSAWNGKKK